MNRLDLPYVLVTATVGIALFCAGYMVRPTPQKVACVEAPIVQARVEPIPPPPPAAPAPVVAPVTTVDSLPTYSGTPVLAAPMGTIGDNLLPIVKAPAAPSASVAHPVPVVTPVAAPKPLAPEPIVLEEIPDNPYARQRKTVASTPGF